MKEKGYALISEYALICSMRLITREYSIITIFEFSTIDLVGEPLSTSAFGM